MEKTKRDRERERLPLQSDFPDLGLRLGHNGVRRSRPPSWRGFGDFFGGSGGHVLEFLWVFELKFML